MRSSEPAVVVLDFCMPGLTGVEVLEQIRADPDIAETPVLILTAWSSEHSRDEAEKLGATWLQKPLSGEALMAAVGRMIKH